MFASACIAPTSVGNISSAEQLSYAVMGGDVNIGARLASTTREFGASICIRNEIHERTRHRIATRSIQRVAVRGRSAEIMVYELLGIVDSTDSGVAGEATRSIS